MASVSDIRNGMILRWKHGLYEIIEFLHVKPGKGAAFVRTKLRNLRTGQVLDNTFRNSDRLDEVQIEKTHKQYLYYDGDFYIFMDNETYEQISVPKDVLSNISKYMKENINLVMKLDEDGNIIDVELPINVVQKIETCEPNIKGNTASRSGKSATTETGLDVTVPFFIEQGDEIKIDTRNGEYVERV
ncbi:MAG: elongation factor P [Candidatus Cloacimonadota bacterium]|nr:elongation factor P [Candidatus Cloacimonadota bacterium]